MPTQTAGGSFPRDEGVCVFPLSRLRKLFDPAPRSVQVDVLQHSTTPATVYRLTLDDGRATLIAKRIAPNWGEDIQGYRREFEFYRHWANQLAFVLPEVIYAGQEPETGYGLVLLQDLAATHRFFTTNHIWKPEELERALRAYAKLHVQGYSLLDKHRTPEWLFPRYEARILAQAAEIPQMVAYLVKAGLWRPLPRLERFIQNVVADIQAFADLPVTLLHNDVAPQNIGLGVNSTAAPDVALLDWEMVGWGLPEMDLAYIFMQPFGNTRDVDRTEMLTVYWQERQRLEGTLAPSDVRQAVQQYADSLFALWLIPVAYERYKHPFPSGSAPYIYWSHMFTVLEERLRMLTAV